MDVGAKHISGPQSIPAAPAPLQRCKGRERRCGAAHVDFISGKCGPRQRGKEALGLQDPALDPRSGLLPLEDGLRIQQAHAPHLAAGFHSLGV